MFPDKHIVIRNLSNPLEVFKRLGDEFYNIMYPAQIYYGNLVMLLDVNIDPYKEKDLIWLKELLGDALSEIGETAYSVEAFDIEKLKYGEVTHKEIRTEFEEFVGTEKYRHFVLTLYEAFPLRDQLFFWQEELLEEFSTHFKRHVIQHSEVHKIFNHCPVHKVQLKSDTVAIVDGSKASHRIPYSLQEEFFPLANVDAPRNLEMFEYPEDIDVLYCEQCRKTRKEMSR
ncbi:hypothetical protein [Pseudotenacibaculum haliotis]|uniref:Uncharacterized protein n=1 Tax=Pseudotenacibaculum haliotis TaxID=1862138 RepID=A0ABW5LQP7_9FLAO